MQLKVIKNYLIDLDGVILDIKYDTFFGENISLEFIQIYIILAMLKLKLLLHSYLI